MLSAQGPLPESGQKQRTGPIRQVIGMAVNKASGASKVRVALCKGQSHTTSARLGVCPIAEPPLDCTWHVCVYLRQMTGYGFWACLSRVGNGQQTCAA